MTDTDTKTVLPKSKLVLGSIDEPEQGWWDSPWLLMRDRRVGIWHDVIDISMEGLNYSLAVGAYMHPTDNRWCRIIVTAQVLENPRLLFNKTQDWYYDNGIYSALDKVIRHLAKLAAKYDLEPQVMRLGNNSHDVVDNSSTLRIGTPSHPSFPHYHVLLRQVPGVDLLGIGVPYLSPTPVGKLALVQSPDQAERWSPEDHAKVVSKLRDGMDDASNRATCILIRHGKTYANAAGVLQGSHPTLDSATLTPESIDAAKALGVKVVERYPDASRVTVVASELPRARVTAECIIQAWGEAAPTLTTSPDIIERSFGAAEGTATKFDDIANNADVESVESVLKRVRRFVETHVNPIKGGQVIIVVGHGHCTLAMTAVLSSKSGELGSVGSRPSNLCVRPFTRGSQSENWKQLPDGLWLE